MNRVLGWMALGVCVTAAAGCGTKKEGPATSPADAAPAAPARPPATDVEAKALHRRVGETKPPGATARPGFPPASKAGDAGEDYQAAAELVAQNPDAADKPHDPQAQSVVALVRAGAAKPTSLSPVARAQDAARFASVGNVVLAVGYAELGAGRHVSAAAHGLLAARLAQDITRDAGWNIAETMLPLGRKGLELARTALEAAGSSVRAGKDFAPLLGACDALRAGVPPLALTAAAEADTRDRMYVGVAVKPTYEAIDAYAAARKALLAAVAEDAPGGVLSEKLEAARATDLADAPLLRADLATEWTLAHADMVGTCLIVALEDKKRARGGVLPSTLKDLTSKAMPTVPPEPVRGGAWELVDDGIGGRLLRSGPVVKDGKPVAIELPIHGKAKK